MNFEKAKEYLDKLQGDPESFHADFDKLLEIRLFELDPKFMQAMHDYYVNSGVPRWYA